MDKTSRLGLNLPDKGFRDWDVPINENFSLLDAADGQNVKVSGNQTINDIKVFTNSILRRISNLDVTTTPATTQYLDWLSPQDKNGVSVGYFGTVHRNNGLLTSRLGVTRFIDGAGKYQDISVSIAEDGTIFTQAPTPPTNDSSTQIATTANVDAKITAQAAKLTGNQIINGIKTLTETVVGLGAPINFIAQNNNIEKGVTPAANQYCGYDFRGKTGVRLAYLGIAYISDGRKYLDLQKLDTNLTHLNCQLPIKTPTPATTDNSTTAATTAWVNNKHQVVTEKPSSPTAGVFYFIRE